ncbi:hypothetical protein WJX74_005261 [Apatococcus lobatus]|uniref:ABC-type xenobiotic transporter n=1 Tax=Apatococcus lobatus TaxID=904363 RepID=A0AAW1RD54_9CHLO
MSQAEPLLPSRSGAAGLGNARALFASLSFNWVGSLLASGSRKEQLDDTDLFELDHPLLPAVCCRNLFRAWRKEQATDEGNEQQGGQRLVPPLLQSIAAVHGRKYLALGLVKLGSDALNFSGPLLLNALLHYLSQSETSRQPASELGSPSTDLHKGWLPVPIHIASSQPVRDVLQISQLPGSREPRHGYGLVVAIALATVLKAILDSQYSWGIARLGCQLRTGLTCTAYCKTLALGLADASAFPSGQVQTLASVDTDRVVGLCASLHDLWSLPVQIIIALVLLYAQVQWAFLAGLAVVIALIPLNRWLAGVIQRASLRMMTAKDERIRLIGEMLRGIRQIKLAAWEPIFLGKVEDAREKELKALAVRKYMDAFCVYLWATTSLLFTLLTFGLFTLLGHQLTASAVFTSLALFNVLIAPLNSFPWVINGTVEGLVSVSRLQGLFSAPETKASWIENEADSKAPVGSWSWDSYHPPSAPPFVSSTAMSRESTGNAITLDQLNACWTAAPSSGPDAHPPASVLHRLSMGFPQGKLSVINGEIGAGKSALLLAMLGELHLPHGSATGQGRVAYVPQSPWLMAASVRDNVTFGQPLDSGCFDRVIHACALTDEVAALPHGDMTFVGSRGVMLSGGQQARLALARALYQEADVYLLDDVLAALDPKVAQWVLEHAIAGSMRQGRTLVLCTHATAALPFADLVWRLEGTAEQARAASAGLASAGGQLMTEERSGPNAAGAQESRQEGHVRAGIWAAYAGSMGWMVTILIAASLLLMQATRNGNDLWLSHWVSQSKSSAPENPNPPPGSAAQDIKFYLGILATFAGANSVFTFARAFSFAYGGMVAAKQTHARLLSAIVKAPCSFFDRTPTGRILNRFSSDSSTVDDSLPFILNILLANIFSALGILAVLLWTQALLLLPCLPLFFIYQNLASYYQKTAREVRRLSSIARSPVYASFEEALEGGPVIRASEAQLGFAGRMHTSMAILQRANIAGAAVSQWLGLRLQMLAATVTGLVALAAVLQKQGLLPGSHSASGLASLVGLSLSYAFPLTGLLSGLLATAAETEQEMVSMERVQEWSSLQPQADMIAQSDEEGLAAAGLNQPQDGAATVSFQDVWLRYSPDLSYALKGISFQAHAGESLAICGRTGAGKSSIIAALTRLTEIQDGTILLHGQNIQAMSLARLRQCVAVIPQQPFLFQGTLRENLDPEGAHTTEEVEAILQRTGLVLQNADGSCLEDEEKCGGRLIGTLVPDGIAKEEPQHPNMHLRMGIGGSGAGLSAGQQQLICIARILVRHPSVIFLDEATAHTDGDTAARLQQLLSLLTCRCTIIQIAHSQETILQASKVLVMMAGEIVESGDVARSFYVMLSKRVALSAVTVVAALLAICIPVAQSWDLPSVGGGNLRPWVGATVVAQVDIALVKQACAKAGVAFYENIQLYFYSGGGSSNYCYGGIRPYFSTDVVVQFAQTASFGPQAIWNMCYWHGLPGFWGSWGK